MEDKNIKYIEQVKQVTETPKPFNPYDYVGSRPVQAGNSEILNNDGIIKEDKKVK